MSYKKSIKKLIPKKVFTYVEPLGHKGEAAIINAVNGFPAKGIKVIGVTGTNGKTTTSFMIHKMLTKAGIKAGLMTTVAYGIGDDIHPQVHHMTNVTVTELMGRLKWMKQQKMEWLVLEVTSHGLAQNRVWGMPFSVAVMTNITHEHLDYHGTFKRYKAAKKKLFTLTNRNKKGLQVGIINAEDPAAPEFAKAVKNPVTYGLKNGDLQTKNVIQTPKGSTFTAMIGNDLYDIKCNIPGSFNISNSLAAVAVGRALGLSKVQIEQGLAALDGVEGRMTNINEGQDFEVIVDYAHTPDSFEKLLKDLKPVVTGKFIVMFGSAGRRDKAKRSVQGEIAGRYADIVVITEEDDRDEDGNEIMNQIAKGAEKAGKVRDDNLFLILDRVKAIQFVIDKAAKNDTVLLLGKGHEKTIERDDREDTWDEIGTAKKVVKAKLNK